MMKISWILILTYIMNWLNKFTLIATLTVAIISCTDKEKDNIELQPNNKVGAIFVDSFSVNAYTVAIDSTFSGKNNVVRHLTGVFDSPSFGKMIASSYAELILPDLELDFGNNSVYNSCELHLKLNYTYGNEGENCIVLINKVSESIDKEKYYTFDNGIIGGNIGSFTINTTDDIGKEKIFTLSNSFGSSIFNQSAAGALFDQSSFKKFIKGITLQPQSGNAILGFDTEKSFIRIKYTSDTIKHKDFYFNNDGNHFNHVVSDRSGTVLEGLKNRVQLNYKDILTKSLYLEGSTRLNAKLNFPTIAKFLDNEKFLIYRAELEITANPNADYKNSEILNLYSTDGSNREFYNDFLATNGGGAHFVKLKDGKYIFDLTDYLQRVSHGSFEMQDFMLSISPNGHRVDQLKINDIQENIKINLYYTELK